MKRIIPFVNDISLNTRISEITSIALEHNLKMENLDSIVGTFTVSGKYKINDVSINEEVFEKKLDFDITLDDKYDSSKVIIDIDNFYYEVVNDELLRVHIDVLVNNLVYAKEKIPKLKEKEENISELRNVGDDEKTNNINEKEGDVMSDALLINNDEKRLDENEKNEVKEEKQEQIDDSFLASNSFNNGFLSTEEKYSTYKVHIIRENESIKQIKEMYNVSEEELLKYNDLDNVILGSKIIIPLPNE